MSNAHQEWNISMLISLEAIRILSPSKATVYQRSPYGKFLKSIDLPNIETQSSFRYEGITRSSSNYSTKCNQSLIGSEHRDCANTSDESNQHQLLLLRNPDSLKKSGFVLCFANFIGGKRDSSEYYCIDKYFHFEHQNEFETSFGFFSSFTFRISKR